MITLQRSLNSLLLVISLTVGVANAQNTYCPRTFDVLERDGGTDYKFVPKKLEKLFCTERFEGEYFKIVNATEEEAISFEHEDKELLKKAANVYHHLTLARNYWINDIKSDFVRKLPQITIRLNITNAFSSIRHFKNAEQEKNYNNAWTIPEGETPRFVTDGHKWGKEIWFSPMKKIENRKLVKSEGKNPVHESLVLLKDPVVNYNTSALIYQGLGLLIAPEINPSATLEGALPHLGAIAIMYGLLHTTKYMDKWFVDKYYFIDTAMVPEVIYHEYAHIAMSDTMKTVHSVPVIEGMADYFATRVANRRKMYQEIKDYSNNRAKDINNNSFYHPYLEGSWNATSDFTLSLLWLGREKFEELNVKRAAKGQEPIANYDELIHDGHFHLTEDSNIATDLTKAIINACKSKCKNVRAGVSILHQTFEQKGMN